MGEVSALAFVCGTGVDCVSAVACSGGNCDAVAMGKYRVKIVNRTDKINCFIALL